MLSDSELLAIIISTGTTVRPHWSWLRIYAIQFPSPPDFPIWRHLRWVSYARSGDGRVKAIKIAASLELGRRLQMNIAEPSPRLNSPQLIYQYMRSNYDFNEQEYLWTLNFNTKHELISCDLIAVGGLNRAAYLRGDLSTRASNTMLLRSLSFIIIPAVIRSQPSGLPHDQSDRFGRSHDRHSAHGSYSCGG